MHWTVVASLFCFVGFVAADPIRPPISVQPSTPGRRYAAVDPAPPTRWEVFIDINCPDSRRGWDTVREVQTHYATNGPQQIDLVFQAFAVPYHINALLSIQGLLSVDYWDTTQYFPYADAVLDHLEELVTAASMNKSENQVIGELADIAVETTGIDRDFFITDIHNHISEAVGIWKYDSKRGVAAPPTYFVNGVDVVVGQDFVPTFDDWIAYFDSHFASS